MADSKEAAARRERASLILHSFRNRAFFTSSEILHVVQSAGYNFAVIGKMTSATELVEAGIHTALTTKQGTIYSWDKIWPARSAQELIDEYAKAMEIISNGLKDAEGNPIVLKDPRKSAGFYSGLKVPIEEVPKMCSLVELLESIVFEPQNVKFKPTERKY